MYFIYQQTNIAMDEPQVVNHFPGKPMEFRRYVRLPKGVYNIYIHIYIYDKWIYVVRKYVM